MSSAAKLPTADEPHAGRPAAAPEDDRLAVWDALSDLFLDTDPALCADANARALAEAPYSLAELEAILLWEVYPALWKNLASVAGAWAGFDRKWLHDRIARRASLLSRLRTATFGRWWVAHSPSWRVLKQKVGERRAAS